MGLGFLLCRIIPPDRSLDLLERLFPLKRLQRDGGVAGSGSLQQNNYREGIVTILPQSP